MTDDQIKEIALANGFKLKEQPSGEMDLNPYVYDFAKELMHKVDTDWENRIETIEEEHSKIVVGLCNEITSMMRELQKSDEVTDD